jgi:hypothetical protein
MVGRIMRTVREWHPHMRPAHGRVALEIMASRPASLLDQPRTRAGPPCRLDSNAVAPHALGGVLAASDASGAFVR